MSFKISLETAPAHRRSVALQSPRPCEKPFLAAAAVVVVVAAAAEKEVLASHVVVAAAAGGLRAALSGPVVAVVAVAVAAAAYRHLQNSPAYQPLSQGVPCQTQC